jgi:hypothetical protein
MFHDIRFALRMLRRAPGFSLLAIVCLTLGIERSILTTGSLTVAVRLGTE